MCKRLECSHIGETMCSCEAIQFSDHIEKIIHLYNHIRDPKAELIYETLEAPYPYRLCVSGTCKKCGGRLCICVGHPQNLAGDGFLTTVYRHLYHLLNAEFSGIERFRQMFAELFHEQDRSYIRHWLALPENQDISQMYLREQDNLLPENRNSGDLQLNRNAPPAIYTIVQTAADADRGFFPNPVAQGSFLSIDLAREQLAELIAAEKENLSSRYDKEERSDDCWEVYENGYAASLFLRIEILTSELTSNPKGGLPDA